jgi:hypothetical protein
VPHEHEKETEYGVRENNESEKSEARRSTKLKLK